MYTRKQIMNAIENCLDESESKIIKTRFGIEDGITMTLNEIEIKLGVGNCSLPSCCTTFVQVSSADFGFLGQNGWRLFWPFRNYKIVS